MATYQVRVLLGQCYMSGDDHNPGIDETDPGPSGNWDDVEFHDITIPVESPDTPGDTEEPDEIPWNFQTSDDIFWSTPGGAPEPNSAALDESAEARQTPRHATAKRRARRVSAAAAMAASNLYDIEGTQAYLGGISRSTVLRLRAQGEIKPIYISPRVPRFTREELDRYIARREGHQPELPIPLPMLKAEDRLAPVDPNKPRRGRPLKVDELAHDRDLQPKLLEMYRSGVALRKAMKSLHIADSRLRRWLNTDTAFRTRWNRVQRKWNKDD